VPLSADSAPFLASDDALASALEPVHLPLDSDVTVARPAGDHALVQEVYRLVTGQSLTVTSPRDWSPEEVFPVSPRRDNYRGIILPSATVVSATERRSKFGPNFQQVYSAMTETVHSLAFAFQTTAHR